MFHIFANVLIIKHSSKGTYPESESEALQDGDTIKREGVKQ